MLCYFSLYTNIHVIAYDKTSMLLQNIYVTYDKTSMLLQLTKPLLITFENIQTPLYVTQYQPILFFIPDYNTISYSIFHH